MKKRLPPDMMEEIENLTRNALNSMKPEYPVYPKIMPSYSYSNSSNRQLDTGRKR